MKIVLRLPPLLLVLFSFAQAATLPTEISWVGPGNNGAPEKCASVTDLKGPDGLRWIEAFCVTMPAPIVDAQLQYSIIRANQAGEWTPWCSGKWVGNGVDSKRDKPGGSDDHHGQIIAIKFRVVDVVNDVPQDKQSKHFAVGYRGRFMPRSGSQIEEKGAENGQACDYDSYFLTKLSVVVSSKP